MELTFEEKAYFEDVEVWRYGPCYDLTFCIERDYPPSKIGNTLIEAGNLILWKGSTGKLPFFTILKAEDAPPIGFIHTYRHRPELTFSTYQLSIYPRQFIRYVGAESWEDVSKINLQKFQQLHSALFNLVRVVHESSPLFCASICDESYGWHSEANSTLGVYMLARHIHWLNNLSEPSSSKSKEVHFEFIEF